MLPRPYLLYFSDSYLRVLLPCLAQCVIVPPARVVPIVSAPKRFVDVRPPRSWTVSARARPNIDWLRRPTAPPALAAVNR